MTFWDFMKWAIEEHEALVIFLTLLVVPTAAAALVGTAEAISKALRR